MSSDNTSKTPPKKINPIRETTDEARALAHQLIRASRHAALAVIDPKTGFPAISRTLVANHIDGSIIILTSTLSHHTRALIKDRRVSLLFGDIGKGDPLTHPRISVKCEARRIMRDQQNEHTKLRERFLRQHPKAKLYIDFPDFSFFQLMPKNASLNGGFGKAFELIQEDILINSPAIEDLADIETSAIEHMNDDHKANIQTYANYVTGNKDEKDWQLSAIDCAGINLRKGDQMLRCEFPQMIEDANQLRKVLTDLGK